MARSCKVNRRTRSLHNRRAHICARLQTVPPGRGHSLSPCRGTGHSKTSPTLIMRVQAKAQNEAHMEMYALANVRYVRWDGNVVLSVVRLRPCPRHKVLAILYLALLWYVWEGIDIPMIQLTGWRSLSPSLSGSLAKVYPVYDKACSISKLYCQAHYMCMTKAFCNLYL